MPKEGSNITFKDEKKKIKHPFVIYADFESILEKIDTASPDPKDSYTNKYQKHTPCGFCYYIKSSVGDKYNKLEEYRGSNTPEEFVKRLEKDCVRLTKIMRETNKPMSLTSEQKREFRKNNVCHICEEKIGEGLKVRDHCHLTGKYRGPAHQSCNINYQLPSFIPVFLHNNAHYDTHLFINELSKTSGHISAIPNTDQKYISFTKTIHTSPITHIRFLDTFKFMASPLANLVQNLKEFPCLSEYFSDKDFLTQKGIYPYDYMDSFERFNETQLPLKENFDNKLNNSHISDKDYVHAQNVWEKYNIKNLGEYHDLYLKTDVLLLADVFEAFRSVCRTGYGLDPAHYYTAPGLAWSAMLKMTKQDLDLITDVDMLLMIEKAKRGGISQVCSSSYSKANNKYLPNYDSTKESSYLMYYDANNLYGWAMSQALPYGKLRWVKEKDYTKVLQDVCISTQKQLDDSKVGYYFEVDLKYPEELHIKHKDLPFACEKESPKKEWLSDYQRSFDIGESTEKLLTTLYNKKNYVLHQRNLRQYLSKGLRVEKIHRVLKFNQSHWLKGYIDFNTQRRTESKTDFEKDFYKLMNNAVFGKTMENVRKRQNIRLATSWEQASKLINRPSFTRAEVFTENFCAIHLVKESIEMDKPIYIGTSILDLSKSLMYDYFYINLKSKYKDNVSLLYMDTDSFILKINTDDVYSDMKKDINIYDTSNYSPESELFSSKNKKVIGKFKDELGGNVMSEFVGLRSKAYAIGQFSAFHGCFVVFAAKLHCPRGQSGEEGGGAAKSRALAIARHHKVEPTSPDPPIRTGGRPGWAGAG
uniref:uncharacterized protein n=1 Tax=Myxine glutinosa TaxID=7769 RepID=UPI0035900121